MTGFYCVLLIVTCCAFVKIVSAAELVIHIPWSLGQEGVVYRLDYYPPFGHPAPNTTIASKNIRDVIKFSHALPGTKYDFWLYYSNATHNTLTWTANFTTVPDPPSGLSVYVRSGKQAVISWSPPANGSYTSFKLKINPLVHIPDGKAITIENVENTQYTLKDLVPGATYQVQAFTVFENKESAAYTSRNFTTKPNTPGKFIVWFRNETTLLVLWQPPYPAAIYTHYKVSIDPPDANDFILYVEKEGEPPGPAQAAFKGLVPGRAYNISVQTMSEDEISTPTTAQYRTVPLKPGKITFDKDKITTNSFVVHWEPPSGKSEFDKYHISLGTIRKLPPYHRLRDEPTFWEFKDNLEPGKTYSVVVKTVSGKVTSWPVTADVTLEPLPVGQLQSMLDDKTGTISISWKPNPESTQDSFLVSYHEVESTIGDSNTVMTNQTKIELEALFPGRNYSVTVQAVSKEMKSKEESIYVVTRPSAPIIEDLKPMVDGLNISWKSDVNSKQDKYEIVWIRNDTNDRDYMTIYNNKIILSNLYPGAGYLVKIYAISHELKSEPHEYFQPVFPKPPRNMTIEKTTTNSVIVQWQAPLDSLITEYSIRYKTGSDNQWVRLPAVQNTEAEVTDMTPGERYTIQVNTVSYGLESNEPQQLNHTVRPNPVSNIAPLVDSNNVTLEWPRPEGRVETYIVRWWEATTPSQVNKSTVSQNQNGTGLVRLLVGDLMPGEEYVFDIQAISNDLESDVTVLRTRTKSLVVNNHQSTDSISLRYTPTPQTSSKFDLYRFSLSETNIPDQEKAANDSERLVTFTGLIPGRLYNITVWTVSQGVTSQPLQRQDRLCQIIVEPHGFNSPREFLVTQGPLHSTRDDFWRMVWESNSRAAIMLAGCVEKGREKCDHYWPYDTMPVYYGDISVQILNETRYPDWNISEFMVCRGDQQRVVRHFHFSTWPDFGVPSPPHTLVRFVRAFRERVPPDQRPIVVHCSAGVGRSGTFICLDRIVQQIQTSDYVDIFGIVYAMRKERVWMVQTEQQYICIHQCLLAVLEGKEMTGPPREIHENQGFEDDEGIAESGM
ncbi:tyrosine-protein phosphatase 10D-like [Sitophilus oryzae]|uniref:Tyrosine-protein phosphatase 10D-like n=1 Tax=Sitophilus oryzae TaxID=7048 RepID=A0A6J2XUH1_SITOR|nr:tyrosine-protein phosphatase 10D-like [Sitophilus oryzae]